MSRTFRCKSTWRWHTRSPHTSGEVSTWDRRRAQPGSPAARGAQARAHRDHPSGRFGVPRWYRREINRATKRQQLAELRRALTHDSLDAHSPTPFKECVFYYNW